MASHAGIDILLDLIHWDATRASGADLHGCPESAWAEMCDLAQRHRVTPLLYRRLKERALSDLAPELVLQQLAAAYQANAARNMRLYGELAVLARAAQERGIELVALKGAALAAPVYGNVALRFIGDLDVLAPRAQLPELVALLEERGYRPLHLERVGAFEPHHLPPYKRPGAVAIVEPHALISRPEQRVTIPVEELLARAVALNLPGCRALGLAPEDLLLHLCVHATHHHQLIGVGLRALCDLAALISRMRGALSWDVVAERAERWRCRRGAYLALRLARDLVGAPVPEAALAALAPEDIAHAPLAVGRAALLNQTAYRAMVDMPAHLAALTEQRLLSRRFATIWGRIFVSRAALAYQYQVDPNSPRIYPYYLVRLWGLLLHYAPTMARLLRGDSELRQHAAHRHTIWSWLEDEGARR